MYENGKIYILPALPSELKNGRAKGLKAKGNICVDIVWADGKLQSLTLRSKTAQRVCVVTPMGETTVALKGDEEAVYEF